MSYRTCYLCKHWNENTGFCSEIGTIKSSSDWCSKIDLIPCCASCKNWSLNYDYVDQGNCRIYGGLSPATSICNAGYYTKK